MRLKPTKLGLKNLVTFEKQQNEEKAKQQKSNSNSGKSSKKKGKNKLPSDEYKPLFEPTRFLVRETRSSKDPTKTVKQYVELSVKRFGEDDENQPTVYVQMYQESEFYTGYLKGKTVYFPLEMLYTFIEELEDLSEECDKRKIY